MTTRLDRQIEQLERIVNRRLESCRASWNGLPCRLPANHVPLVPHEYSLDAAAVTELLDNHGPSEEHTNSSENGLLGK